MVITVALVLIASMTADGGAAAHAACVREPNDRAFGLPRMSLESPDPGLEAWARTVSAKVPDQELLKCYTRRLEENPSLQGSFSLLFVVEPDGHVSKAAADFSRPGQAGLRSCMAAVACDWRFPAVPTGDRLTIWSMRTLGTQPRSRPSVDWKPGECPADEGIRKALGVEGQRWTTACRTAGSDRWLVAAVRRPEGAGHLLLAATIVSRSAPTTVLQIRLEGPEGAKIRELARRAEEWQIAIAPPGKSPPEVRIDVVGTSGDDLYVAQQVASFFWIEGMALHPVWTALGNKLDRRFDSCLLESTAAFEFLPGRRVQRTVKTTRTFRSAGVSDQEAARLRKECVPPPRQVETFVIAN